MKQLVIFLYHFHQPWISYIIRLLDNLDKGATVKNKNMDSMDIFYIDFSFLVYPFLISSRLSSIFTCQPGRHLPTQS